MNKEVKKRLLWLSEHKTEDVKEDIIYTLDYIRELEREIERLKAIVEGTKENRNELQQRIYKAIEYIENLEEDYIECERSGFYEYQDKTRCLDYDDVEQKLYNILRGDKE